MPDNALLAIHNLSCAVEQRLLWQGVSFSLVAGRSLGISGPSGSGKSLLLRMLVHLDPVQSGEILFHQKRIQAWNIPTLRQRMIYLPQHPATLEGTVEENLQLVFRFRAHRQRIGAGLGDTQGPVSSDRVYSPHTVLGYLEQFDRGANFLNQSTHHLSGGERQILAIVRALQLKPTVLLLDEPTTALDPDTSHQLEALILNWMSENSNRAYLWVSHNPEQMSRMTDDQVCLSDYQR